MTREIDNPHPSHGTGQAVPPIDAPEPPGDAWPDYDFHDLALIDDWGWQGNPPPPEEFASSPNI